MDHELEQEWRVTKTLPPNYEVSYDGHVRKFKNGSEYVLLKEFNSTGGYLQINAVGKSMLIHRLVAEAFVDNPEGFTIVRHKNGDRKDNTADNLEWISSTGVLTERLNCSTNTKNKILCKELDQVFGSKKTASYVTGVPQDVICSAVSTKLPVFGLTFEEVAYNDERIKDHIILYLDFKKMLEVAYNTDSISDMNRSVMNALNEIC